jgi:hypothetical protein
MRSVKRVLLGHAAGVFTGTGVGARVADLALQARQPATAPVECPNGTLGIAYTWQLGGGFSFTLRNMKSKNSRFDALPSLSLSIKRTD